MLLSGSDQWMIRLQTYHWTSCTRPRYLFRRPHPEQLPANCKLTESFTYRVQGGIQYVCRTFVSAKVGLLKPVFYNAHQLSRCYLHDYLTSRQILLNWGRQAPWKTDGRVVVFIQHVDVDHYWSNTGRSSSCEIGKQQQQQQQQIECRATQVWSCWKEHTNVCKSPVLRVLGLCNGVCILFGTITVKHL